MAGGLTFEQVKQARVFAWHERYYVYANDTLLRVVLPVDLDSGKSVPDHSPMTVRPSSLRGTEHLLDDGWHHLDDCSCRFCAPRRDQVASDAAGRECCGDPARRD